MKRCLRFLFVLLAWGPWGLSAMGPARRPPKVPAAPVDINTACATELLELPHVGPKTAQRILEFRRQNGPFKRPEEIMGVKGLGEKAFMRLRPHITVGASAAP